MFKIVIFLFKFPLLKNNQELQIIVKIVQKKKNSRTFMKSVENMFQRYENCLQNRQINHENSKFFRYFNWNFEFEVNSFNNFSHIFDDIFVLFKRISLIFNSTRI